ncbi:MAG: helix-turn-helix domain-containing protein [Clostridium sp.]
MYMNTGYLNQSHQDFKDKRQPLVVGSCGCYRLSTYPKLPTYRPRGRLDYQIIYIASGKGYFHFDSPENETIVPAGNIVLFRPKELQKNEYYGKDKTEVYWIHFTGGNIKNLLRRYGFADKKRIFPVGTSPEYERLFKRIILELTREHVLKDEYMDREMEVAISYFSSSYNLEINVKEYAYSKGMSTSWFIRNFKKYTGETPIQFITSARIMNAQILLETTAYSVNEISQIVGYSNPSYFSRAFRSKKGYSPQQYRNRMREME